MRDNDSGDFEPDPPTLHHQKRAEHYQRGPQPERQLSRIMSGTESTFVLASPRHPLNDDDDDDNLAEDRIPLLPRLQSESGPSAEGTNTLYTVFLIVNAALGAGLLDFPKSFDRAGGIFVGIAVQGVFLIFIVSALLILAYCSDHTGAGVANTLQDTMSGVAGRSGRVASAACVAVYCFGTTVTFFILIGDQFDRIFQSLVGSNFEQHWYLTREFTTPLCAVICILPMCFSRRIDFLRLPSTLGVLAVIYIVGLIGYEYYSGNYVPGPIKHAPSDWADIFLVIPAITFSYQCHVSAIPVYSCMKQRTLKSFSVVACSAVLICVTCYSAAATWGYLTFGSKVNADILMSYPPEKPEVLAGVIAMALKTISTYPILLFCGREAFYSVVVDMCDIARGREQDAATNDTSLKWRLMIGLPWFFVSLILAIQIPNIGEVIGFLGSLASVFIFIFPGMCLFQVTLRMGSDFSGTKSKMLMSASFIFMFIGAFIFGVVATQAIQSLTAPDISK